MNDTADRAADPAADPGTDSPAAPITAGAVALSLVSHTNVGKTTLARTLLERDIGEVRDAAHVTEAAECHVMIESPDGDRLELWDTPGFGDSVRLGRRLAQAGNPIGWFLTEVWDRFRDRAFWSSQKAIRNVVDNADAVLYLVNASEPPEDAAYLEAELRVLTLLGKPVLVLLNQLGQPQSAAAEDDEIERWRRRVCRPEYPTVRDVLAMDAFARCWVQEGVLLDAVAALLDARRKPVFSRLQTAWRDRRIATFEQSMAVLARRLAATALDREGVVDDGWARRLKSAGAALARRGKADSPRDAAMAALAARLQHRVREDLDQLIRLHGLDGRAGEVVLERLAGSYSVQAPVDEGKAAVLGGVVTGALTGLKADLATGGLTLGGGMLAGGLLGALGAAGLARGFNLVRGQEQPTVAWSDDALHAALVEALLGYLAVAHYGRGRGHWSDGEHPAFWAGEVRAAIDRHRMAWLGWLGQRSGADSADARAGLERAAVDLMRRVGRELLQRLYPSPLAGPSATLGTAASPTDPITPASSAGAFR
jgi:hypothetical protein